MSDLDPAELSAADPATLAFIVQESDKRIAAQVQLMLAADTRSNTLLSVATALSAAAVAVAAGQPLSTGLTPLAAGALAFAAGAAASAAASAWALSPILVDIAGWSPRLFVGDIAARKSPELVLAEVAVQNQRKIDANILAGDRIIVRTRLAMILLASAPVIAALAALARAF